jgi:hypothetical protein
VNLRQIFQSAITEEDGKTVNAGYLALAVVMLIVLGAVPCTLLLAAVQLKVKHDVNLQDVGVSIGAICTGFGVVLGALGMFLKGDKA